MAENIEEKDKISFKDTLNLPTTDFPIRPNAKEDDPKMVARWAAEDIYRKTFEKNTGREKFIFHDGPPYANGHLHLGHAYNKILKDIVLKLAEKMEKLTDTPLKMGIIGGSTATITALVGSQFIS